MDRENWELLSLPGNHNRVEQALAHPATATPIAQAVPRSKLNAGRFASRSGGHGFMKALVIEDSPIFRKVIEHTLEQLNIDVMVVETAGEGYAMLQNERVDLLILDLHLPDQSGLELCRRIRALPVLRMLPVLLLTSDDTETLAQQALDAGVTEVFRKSRLEDLHASLRDFTRRLQREYRGRVLLVEDSPTTAMLLKYMLGKMSLEVDEVPSAEDALVAIEQKSYDLIICDVVLAGEMSGLALVRAVRAMAGDAGRTPILGLSALEDDARKIEMLRLGASDYVAKPVLEEEFAARVGNLITAKQLFDQVQLQRRELRELSIRDKLTGLYNRHYLSEVSGLIVSSAHRRQEPLSFLMIDLDHFKRINDSYGYEVGDKVLAAIGILLSEGSRRGDVAARFGGEEFVFLLPGCTGADAIARAERLLADIRTLKPADVMITASIGVATLDMGREMHFEELFRVADEATHRAKQAGRNRVMVSDSLVM